MGVRVVSLPWTKTSDTSSLSCKAGNNFVASTSCGLQPLPPPPSLGQEQPSTPAPAALVQTELHVGPSPLSALNVHERPDLFFFSSRLSALPKIKIYLLKFMATLNI